MLEIYEVLKLDNKSRVVIIKKNNNYYTLYDDAYVLYELFGFEIIDECCTFKSIKKVTKLLTEKDIGYIVYEGEIIDITCGNSDVYSKYHYAGLMKEQN